MAQRPTADYPIDANTTSGTDLSLILNRFQTALESGNSGSSRPAYITAGGLWVKEGDPMELYLYDGTTDQLLYDTSNGINVTEGLWTLVDSNDEAGEIQRPSDVLIDGNLTVTGEVVDGDGNPISIIDPATEDGVIATWDDAAKQWTPDGDVRVAGGRMAFGFAGYPQSIVHISSGSYPSVRLSSDDGSTNLTLSHTKATGTSDISATGTLMFTTDGTERMSIEANGNVIVEQGSWLYLRSPTAPSPYFRENNKGITINCDNADRFTIDANGDATFSGKVSSPVFYSRAADTCGIGFGAPNPSSSVFDPFIYSTDATGTAVTGTVSLGTPNYWKFKDGFFSGILRASNVTFRNSVGATAKDLIETLSTLRNATKDETTLEGLRDAIGNAVGGLIEKFEAIQAEAKEKLEEAYNQTGTQEITPDNPEVGTMDD